MQFRCSRAVNRLYRLFLLLFLLLLACSLAVAQVPRGSDNSSDASVEGKYVLTGTVVNSVTGEPIPRALVQVNAGVARSMLTDFSGSFRFEGLQQGSFSISSRKPGFFTPEELNQGADPQNAAPSVVQVGPNMQTVALRLVPQGSIVGRLINTEGEGVEDLGVAAFRLQTLDGRKQWQQATTAMTDEGGKFRIGNLAPGIYALRAGPGPAMGVLPPKAASTRELAYRALYYPGTLELTSATLITVQAGQDSEADFSLRAEPVYHIAGSIVGVERAFGFGAELFDSSGESSGALRFRPGLGTFFSDVFGGHYTLRVHAYNGRERLTSVVTLNVNSDMSGIQVAFGPASPIPVRIRVESLKAPVTRSPTRHRNSQWAPATVRLTSVDRAINPPQFESMPIGEASSNDSEPPLQQIRGIDPGRYRAQLISNGRWYVHAATCGSTDLLRENLTVAPGEAVPPIEIVLRDDPGRITGIIQADQPNARAAVLLIPENRSTSDIRVAFATVNKEQFAFDAIAPGDYELIAFDGIAGLEYRNPEVLAPYRSRAVHMSVARGGEANANVPVMRRGTGP